jgi:hypothetical protein
MELIEFIRILRNTLSALLTASSSWFLNSINHGLFLSTTVPQAIGHFTVPFTLPKGLVAQSVPGTLTPLFVLFENYMPHSTMVRQSFCCALTPLKIFSEQIQVFHSLNPTPERGIGYDCSLNWWVRYNHDISVENVYGQSQLAAFLIEPAPFKKV